MKVGLFAILSLGTLVAGDNDYLRLTMKQAVEVANSHRTSAQVGSSFDFRVVATDRSYNYKLRATWMTPEVIRAVARVRQIEQHLSEAQTRKLVADAENVGDTVVMIELHGREGSGVIPSTWQATLGPRGKNASTAGVSSPNLRDFPALVGALRRDYAYDVFWMAFPLRTEGALPLFEHADTEAELTVRIYDKVGRIHWTVPQSIRISPRP